MAGGRSIWHRLKSAWQGAVDGWRHPDATASQQPSHDGNVNGRLLDMLERSADNVIQTDHRGAITYLNASARAALNIPAQGPLPELALAELAPAATRALFDEVVAPALASQGRWCGEAAVRLGGSQEALFSHMALAHRDPHGHIDAYSVVMRDISAQAQAHAEVLRHTQILHAISEAIPATVVIVDSQGRYRFVNSAFERYVGRAASDIIGRTAVDILGAEEVARRKPYMIKALAGEAVSFTLDYPGDQGTTHLSLTCIPLKLDGEVDGFVGIGQDVTVQRREQDRLTHLAERDPLTGLFNRAGFEQRVERKVAMGEGESLALLFIDLDHFKPVNDRLGHLAGDRLLQGFARRLGEAVRGSDVVARLGGDEFAVLLAGVRDEATARAVAEKVLAAANQPFDLEGGTVRVSASVGVAFSARSDANWRELLARADALLYQAKAAGRGRQMVEELVAARERA
ncbi:sensor domain-containing diguanylate cyclase [Piscinibacter terrae]|uniref:Sensor domain-containing diguanylate cyclase n=1 Tax=Piscinibacter terrae TaxID=2496871 RepID=A0A3N7HWW8_9BURK|nr:sensor domain-containing diguanylate cyclase [Albitalea terrae]RQP25926.1 sensor domain-containing diguanylate cyclase [Albitalea terrae]